MKRAAALLLLLLIVPVVGRAADRDVSAVVKALEGKYAIKETHIPWIARAFVKPFLWGSGVTLSFSVFEDQALPKGASLEEIGALTEKALGPEWSRFVTSYSQDGERDVVYVKPEGKHMIMMIVAAEPDETSVVKMRINPDEAQRWMNDPEHKGKRAPKKQDAGKL